MEAVLGQKDGMSLCYDSGDDGVIHLKRHLLGVVLQGEGVAVRIGASRPGLPVTCGGIHGFILAEQPIDAVRILAEHGGQQVPGRLVRHEPLCSSG